MLQDEIGIPLEGPNPIRAGASTFFAFFIIGFIPLISFFINWFFPEINFQPFTISIILTAIAFFIVGAAKAPFISQHWLVSGIEILGVGAVVAAIAYHIGHLLKEFI